MKNRIDKSQRETHHQLRRSARGVDATARRARQIEVAATATQKKLRRAMPKLRQAVEAAQADPNISQDDRARIEREYLEAQSQLQQCERAFQLARRQRVIAGNL